MDKEQSCATCANCKKLEMRAYSSDGCETIDAAGYACTAFDAEGVITWIVGMSKADGRCEGYTACGGEMEER